MTTSDSFVDLARYYDPIMRHVDYDRWYLVTGLVADLLPRPFVHLDVACGTGKLLKKLRKDKWKSFGVDLSLSMLRAGREDATVWPVATGDLRALPFSESVHYVTCLFDSMNFLLKNPDMEAGIRSMAHALKPGGLVYFDVVTERMVLKHFAGQAWTERNGKFSTRWQCEYDRTTFTAETRIRVNKGAEHTLHERIYTQEEIEAALSAAGIELLGVFDAETWRVPGRKTVRIDFVGVRGDASPYRNAFQSVEKQARELLH